MLGATPWMLAGSGGGQSWQGAGRVPARPQKAIPHTSSVITGPPARGGGQSWQGADRVPARPQVAIPPSAAAPPAPLLNRRACRRCWAQHHGRSQAVAVASLGRVPAECRRGLRKLFHIQLRHYRTASTRRGPVLAGCRQSAGEASGRYPTVGRRTPCSPAEPPSLQTMLGATPWSLAGSGGGQSWQGAGRVPARPQKAIPHTSSVITGPPARGGGQSWQGAAKVPARPQKAIPHTALSLPDRQHAEGASLGRVLPECRRGLRSLSHRRPPDPVLH